MKHTPEPWVSTYNNTANGRILCVQQNEVGPSPLIAIIPFTNHIGMKTREANAHLIETAPNLLKSCKELHFEILRILSESGLSISVTTHDVLQKAKQTISKAIRN